ncbi:MAG: enoyl-CoA hydratase/isomerase family protein [Gammaproteobacteria bacterium]|nr:enoyl-CoA hydratase/isomerase family protein [Gammaproteobacteria bacterium]
MTITTYNHWKITRDTDGITWLHLDKADTNTNVLSNDVVIELGAIVETLTQTPPKGVVILSDKASGFIAGADIKEFTGYTTKEIALVAVRRAHQVFNRIEDLPCPTVAMISGFCLGGGMELALACKYRVAEDGPKTKLGLPEVKLGIHPGYGGTVRSIRTAGVFAAMDLMLTGRTVDARAAKRMGLVDHAVPLRQLRVAARAMVITPPAKRPLAVWLRLVNYRLLRPWVANILRKKVAARAPQDHYPAPYALIDLWQKYYDDPFLMLDQEAQSIAQLSCGHTAQSLVRVFLLQEQLKALGRSEDFHPHHVHVIGAGVMGGDIAGWCALRGFTVTLQDQKKEALANVIKRTHGLFKKVIKDRLLVTRAMDRLVPDPKGNGLKRADVVIEAIFEDAEVKRTLFKSIEPQIKPQAILATNTSSIPLDELNTVLTKPSRLVGLHFFNPVSKMPLVEIVQSPTTDKTVAQQAAAFTKQIDRLPLPVSSKPGFLVNRILMPYLMEAMLLAEEAVPLASIDAAALKFGMPMGPIELADTVGLDICLHVAENLGKSMNIEVPARLRQMVQAGHLGRKSGRGFYEFKNDKALKPAIPSGYHQPDDMEHRLIFRMLNEAVACWRDTVVESIDHADAGIIFGTGFAPFRGGPFHYIFHMGVKPMLQLLEQLQQRYGARFTPDRGWATLDSKK